MFQVSTKEQLLELKKKDPEFNINLQDYLGNTLTHICVLKNNNKLLEYILSELGPDIDIKNVQQKQSIFYANIGQIDIFLKYIGPRIFAIFNGSGNNILSNVDINKAFYERYSTL